MRRRRVIGWLVALIVLVVLLVVADRVSAAEASNQAEHYLAEQADFEQRPSVTIKGFPFLTQAVGGRYGDVQVTAAAVELDGVKASDLRAELHGVHLPLSKVFGGTVTALPVDSITGTLEFDYPEIERLTALSGLALTDQDGQLHVSATVPIPTLNVTTTVSGSAAIQVENGALKLSVTGLSAAGSSVPASALSALEASLSVPIPIPALPYGLRVTAATPTAGGIVVRAAATNVVIAPAG